MPVGVKPTIYNWVSEGTIQHHCFCDAEIAQLVESWTFTGQAIVWPDQDLISQPLAPIGISDANAKYIYQYTYLLMPGKYTYYL